MTACCPVAVGSQSVDTAIVCHCLQISREQVVFALTTLGIRSIGDLREHTGAGDGCMACHKKLKSLIAQHS